jgi:hypothetical protein
MATDAQGVHEPVFPDERVDDQDNRHEQQQNVEALPPAALRRNEGPPAAQGLYSWRPFRLRLGNPDFGGWRHRTEDGPL